MRMREKKKKFTLVSSSREKFKNQSLCWYFQKETEFGFLNKISGQITLLKEIFNNYVDFLIPLLWI